MLVSQPQGARQLKVGTGLTQIEIEKLGVRACEEVHERDHRTGCQGTWTDREVPAGRR